MLFLKPYRSLSYNTIRSRNNNETLRSNRFVSSVNDCFLDQKTETEERSLMSITISLDRDWEEAILIHQTQGITCGNHTDSVMIRVEKVIASGWFSWFTPSTDIREDDEYLFLLIFPSSLQTPCWILIKHHSFLFIFLSLFSSLSFSHNKHFTAFDILWTFSLTSFTVTQSNQEVMSIDTSF